MTDELATTTETTPDPVVSWWRGEPICVQLVVPGPVPRKNRRTRTRVVPGRKPGESWVQYYPSAEWKDWIWRLQLASIGVPKIGRGAWAISIRAYTDRISHLDGDTLRLPLGDVDSPTSAVLDGLQDKSVELLDDDARFVDERATKHYDKFNPRTEIEIVRVDPEPVTIPKRTNRKRP